MTLQFVSVWSLVREPALNKFHILSFSVLFIFTPSSFADMNSANEALARGDHAAAAAEFERLAEQGDKKAQANLGYMYYVGEGVAQDYVQAVKWYKKAAILGDRDSQYNLAVAYAFGEGVKQDYKDAYQWYRRAAEQEHAVAQYSLGISYAYGEGVSKNPELAAEWFQKSAEQGYERAQVLLGSLYHTGEGVEKDYEKAALWYRKAADKGNAAAQYNLGSLYRAGNGVEQDYNQAVRWFRLSADQGYAAAQNELDSIERAVAGANRPAPAAIEEPVVKPAPEVATATVQTESKAEATTSKAAPEATSEVTSTTETAIKEEPKQGFFSKLFGKQAETDSAPEQSGVVYANPEQIAAEEKTHVPVPVTAPPSTPDIETNTPASTDVSVADTEESKRGFFSKLFGKAEATDTDPTQNGVVYATPEEIKAAEKESLVGPATTIIDTSEPEENPEENIDSPAITGSTVVLSEEERPKQGFFSKLFSADDTDEAVTEASEVDVTDQIALNETSRVKTYAADSAPAGQRLESSSETRIEASQQLPENITTDIEETSEANVPGDEEAAVLAEEVIEPDTPKKGFFARLFGNDEVDNEAAITSDAIEDETPDETLVIAKLEGSDTSIVEQEASISSIDVTSDLENVTSASDIQPLAVQGDATAQFQLGALYYQGKSVRQDYSQAFLWYRRAAQQGNVEAQYSLGNMYLMGEGIGQDDYEAKQWYEKAAAQGHESAQHNLESLQRIAIAEPAAVEEDASEINSLSEQDEDTLAAEESGKKKGFFSKLFGSDDKADESDVYNDEFSESESVSELATETDISNTPKGIYESGLAYEFGEGVPQNYHAAFELFRRSAEQDYAPAQYKLGLAYAYGQGVEKNPEIAAEWYRKSASQGYALAQRTLGSLYMGGDGVEQNKSLALAWYNILADSGNVMDVHRRDTLKAKLTEDEIEEADKLKQQLSN